MYKQSLNRTQRKLIYSTRSSSSFADNGAKIDIKDRKGRTALDADSGLAGGSGFDGSSGTAHAATEVLKKLTR